jgi:hypothetical protein
MHGRAKSLHRRFDSLKQRIEELGSLRDLLRLPPEADILKRQWRVIESQLRVAEDRLLTRLKAAGRAFLPMAHEIGSARKLNASFGELELETSRAYTFFDTYMDVLTQRRAEGLGPLLRGCDVLAWDSLYRDHPALAIIEPPLVCCDRGFGASTRRESVRLPWNVPNPMPLIYIPYSRLKEKYNLTSIYHEAGHEALVRLGLVHVLPKVFRQALHRERRSAVLQDLWALWSSEIGPDFWTFCNCGLASAGAIREILALPPSEAFRVSPTDPHPPPYVRVLLSFELCRRVWGRGIWDRWQQEWVELYPLSAAPAPQKRWIVASTACVPTIARALLTTRFRTLEGKRLPDLFDMAALEPRKIADLADSIGKSPAALKLGRTPVQLAAFRLLRERGQLTEAQLDDLMTQWLEALGKHGAMRSAEDVKERRAS